MTHSSGRVWCAGGFDGQQTLGDTLCIDVQQLGQLKAISHSTKPETFAQPEQESAERRSTAQADGKLQDEGGDAGSAGGHSNRMSEVGLHAEDASTAQKPAGGRSRQGIAVEERAALDQLLSPQQLSLSPSSSLPSANEKQPSKQLHGSADQATASQARQSSQQALGGQQGKESGESVLADCGADASIPQAVPDEESGRGHYPCQSLGHSVGSENRRDTPKKRELGDAEVDKRNESTSRPQAGWSDRLEATAMDTATLKELITEMKSGQISRKQSVELGSKDIACSIAQGAPLSPRLQTPGARHEAA